MKVILTRRSGIWNAHLKYSQPMAPFRRNYADFMVGAMVLNRLAFALHAVHWYACMCVDSYILKLLPKSDLPLPKIPNALILKPSLLESILLPEKRSKQPKSVVVWSANSHIALKPAKFWLTSSRQHPRPKMPKFTRRALKPWILTLPIYRLMH